MLSWREIVAKCMWDLRLGLGDLDAFRVGLLLASLFVGQSASDFWELWEWFRILRSCSSRRDVLLSQD